MFDRNFEKEITSKAQKQVATAFFGALGAVFLVGWVLFLTYAAFRPDGWPYIGLWTAFGISYLFRYLVITVRNAS